jgi:hypothetical protein
MIYSKYSQPDVKDLADDFSINADNELSLAIKVDSPELRL